MDINIVKNKLLEHTNNYYTNGIINNFKSDEDIVEIMKKLLSGKEFEVVNLLWDTNPNTNQPYTYREVADILHCSRSEVYQCRDRSLYKLSRERTGIVVYEGGRRILKEKEFDEYKYCAVRLTYLNKTEGIEESIKLDYHGKLTIQRVFEGTTRYTTKTLHDFNMQQFQELAHELYNRTPFCISVYKGNENCFRISISDRHIHCHSTGYIIGEYKKYAPISTLKEIQKMMGIEHPFFTEIEEYTKGIELENYAEVLFPVMQFV